MGICGDANSDASMLPNKSAEKSLTPMQIDIDLYLEAYQMLSEYEKLDLELCVLKMLITDDSRPVQTQLAS